LTYSRHIDCSDVLCLYVNVNHELWNSWVRNCGRQASW